jgi:hypothetical protein
MSLNSGGYLPAAQLIQSRCIPTNYMAAREVPDVNSKKAGEVLMIVKCEETDLRFKTKGWF